MLTDIATSKMTFDDISALIFADTNNISRNILNCLFQVIHYFVAVFFNIIFQSITVE